MYNYRLNTHGLRQKEDTLDLSFFRDVFGSLDSEDYRKDLPTDSCNIYDGEGIVQRVYQICTEQGWDITRAGKEIYKLVMIGLRGNIREDQLSMYKGEREIQRLARIFGIQLREKRGKSVPLKPDTLTFTRMVSLFPQIASNLCRSAPDHLHQKVKDDGQFGAKRLPIGMRHSGFASLIPDSEAPWANLLLHAHTAHMIEFYDVINSEDISRSTLQKFKRQMQYAKVAQKNSVVSKKTKMATLKSVGLNKSEGLRALVDVANDLLTAIGEAELFDFERMHDFFVGENAQLFCDEDVAKEEETSPLDSAGYNERSHNEVPGTSSNPPAGTFNPVNPDT